MASEERNHSSPRSQTEKNRNVFALLPSPAADVLEKDKMRLARLAAKRKEQEELESNYMANASQRKKMEERQARMKAREEREKAAKEAAWAAERDRRMLLLIIARRDADSRGDPFDETEFLADLERKEQEKQQQIYEKKLLSQPNKLHVKEIMAVVEKHTPKLPMKEECKPISSQSVSPVPQRTPPRTPNKNKVQRSPATKHENTFLMPAPKPKKMMRDLTAITAEQRAQARRALVRQTFEAARKKGKVNDTEEMPSKDTNEHSSASAPGPSPATNPPSSSSFSSSSSPAAMIVSSSSVSAVSGGVLGTSSDTIATDNTGIPATTTTTTTAPAPTPSCTVLSGSARELVLEGVPIETTTDVPDRSKVERALQLAKGQVQSHVEREGYDEEEDQDEAALAVAMALLDKLTTDTEQELGITIARGDRDRSSSIQIDEVLNNRSSSTVSETGSELLVTPQQSVKLNMVPPATPPRLKKARNPLQQAVAAARRMAIAENRYFNEDEFTRYWLAEQAAEEEALAYQTQSTEQTTNPPVTTDQNESVSENGSPLSPPVKNESNSNTQKEASKDREKGKWTLDRMRLSLVAARTAAIEQGLPWDEEKFKKDFWAKEAEETETALQRTPDRKKQTAAEREQRMLALAAQMRVEREQCTPGSETVDDQPARGSLDGGDGAPNGEEKESLEYAGVKAALTKLQNCHWLPEARSPPGRLVNSPNLSAQVAAAIKGSLMEHPGGISSASNSIPSSPSTPAAIASSIAAAVAAAEAAAAVEAVQTQTSLPPPPLSSQTAAASKQETEPEPEPISSSRPKKEVRVSQRYATFSVKAKKKKKT